MRPAYPDQVDPILHVRLCEDYGQHGRNISKLSDVWLVLQAMTLHFFWTDKNRLWLY